MQWSETNESWHDKLIDQYAHSWMNEQQIVVFNYFPPLCQSFIQNKEQRTNDDKIYLHNSGLLPGVNSLAKRPGNCLVLIYD